jgi:DNA-binding PadR family transcriptional regulator
MSIPKSDTLTRNFFTEAVAGKVRQVYTLTEAGRTALDESLLKARELMDEITIPPQGA